MYYLFPFHLIEKGTNIVLYGAGNAGKNFAKQVQITKHCNIVGVVDRNHEKAQVRNIPVYPIEWLKTAEYDLIFITIVDEKIQLKIKKSLVKIGIEVEKIICFVSPAMDWDCPNRGFFNQKEEYELNKKVGGYLEEIDPSMLLSSDRIDVIVRFLFFKDILNDIENKEHLSLFSRFTMARTGGQEVPSYFSGAGKNSVQEFIEKSRELCTSIKENGFYEEYYIPLGNDRRPYDGLHRMAAALAAGEKIFVHDYSNRDAVDCNMRWFKTQGFSFEDRVRIVRGFTDIYPGKSGIFVLFSPFSNLWEFMGEQISNHFKVIDVLDFHYEDNYIAFENVLRQIYWDWNQYSEWLTRKLDMLVLAPLRYRIIIVSDEKSNKDFYGEIRKLKLRLRDALAMDVDGRVPIQLHSSDNEDEFYHLQKIFLSANQYSWEMRKTQHYYRAWFLNAIDKLKHWCSTYSIKIEDVCVVGSGVLELYGIREAHNLNFIVLSGLEFSIEGVDSDLEWMQQYGIDENGKDILGDILISDNEYHTVFSDIKFCNPEFVYRKKKSLKRDKDLLDIKKMEAWYQMVIGMEDRKFLNQQVERELYKRGLIK